MNAEVGKRARRKEKEPNNSNRPETTHTHKLMRHLQQRLFLPRRSLQPQATRQQSKRQDKQDQDVVSWSNLIDGGHNIWCPSFSFLSLSRLHLHSEFKPRYFLLVWNVCVFMGSREGLQVSQLFVDHTDQKSCLTAKVSKKQMFMHTLILEHHRYNRST